MNAFEVLVGRKPNGEIAQQAAKNKECIDRHTCGPAAKHVLLEKLSASGASIKRIDS